MDGLTHNPALLFAISFVTLLVAAAAGSWLLPQYSGENDEHNEHLDVVHAATLTLLGLLIGFSFSMAASRYDQRKNLEEAEANAIGTEMLRADLLPAADAASVRKLLTEYTASRMQFYLNTGAEARKQNDRQTVRLQTALWSTVRASATAQPTPVEALALAGMNDVINSQGYTLAAFRNRIPTGAWLLMVVTAIFSHALTGYRSGKVGRRFLFILPIVVSSAFMLIADIDAPRHGLIEVRPKNLEALATSLGNQAH